MNGNIKDSFFKGFFVQPLRPLGEVQVLCSPGTCSTCLHIYSLSDLGVNVLLCRYLLHQMGKCPESGVFILSLCAWCF